MRFNPGGEMLATADKRDCLDNVAVDQTVGLMLLTWHDLLVDFHSYQFMANVS